MSLLDEAGEGVADGPTWRFYASIPKVFRKRLFFPQDFASDPNVDQPRANWVCPWRAGPQDNEDPANTVPNNNTCYEARSEKQKNGEPSVHAWLPMTFTRWERGRVIDCARSCQH